MEHWLNAFGFASVVYGAYMAAQQSASLYGIRPKKERYRLAFLKKLKQHGGKVNEDELIWILKTQDSKIYWLEEGNIDSGLDHILLEHAKQFANKGMPISEISDFILTALEEGIIVGYQGNSLTRPIYQVMYKDRLQRVAITVSDKGYIVGANPRSIKKMEGKF